MKQINNEFFIAIRQNSENFEEFFDYFTLSSQLGSCHQLCELVNRTNPEFKEIFPVIIIVKVSLIEESDPEKIQKYIAITQHSKEDQKQFEPHSINDDPTTVTEFYDKLIKSNYFNGTYEVVGIRIVPKDKYGSSL